jgi:hypothetical protein
VCPDCFRYAELLKPAGPGAVELSPLDRALIQRAASDHKAFADAERAASERRIEECRDPHTPNVKDFVLSFDGAKAIPAIHLPQQTGDAQGVKSPVQWLFLSMFNANLNRMRFVTSTIDFNKGANFQCTLVWEEILLMWQRAEQMKQTAKGTVPAVGAHCCPRRSVLDIRVGVLSASCWSPTRVAAQSPRPCSSSWGWPLFCATSRWARCMRPHSSVYCALTQRAQSAAFKNLVLGHTYNRNDQFHGSVFATLKPFVTLALAEVMEVLHDERPGGEAADIVAVQGIYDWSSLGDVHVAALEGIFGLNRCVACATVVSV